ncbi:uncharacterized protein LOC126736688 isoform X1 [Anthonomus grandis grandis]|uniref:uncharacterized protein LOC126736688 isoform X1 n=1 Tax=Anthonomus grandis grandis TaxID=2921223 RepID=UPI0021668EAD|nr:uncharacterized protein LOC126736688 isoform X1 [Anthonomus grandis grandis]
MNQIIIIGLTIISLLQTTFADDTTLIPDDTTLVPDDTTLIPDDTTLIPDDTTLIPDDDDNCKIWTCAATLCLHVLPCPRGTTLVGGRGYCGCCNECVTPQLGDPCYEDGITRLPTCGKLLKCDIRTRTCVQRWIKWEK